jgi:hypothetical protein
MKLGVGESRCYPHTAIKSSFLASIRYVDRRLYSNWMVIVHTAMPHITHCNFHCPRFHTFAHLSPVVHHSSPVHVVRYPLSQVIARYPPAVTSSITQLSISSRAIVCVQVAAMKIHLCFAIMFLQLVASVRQDARSLLARATVLETSAGGAKLATGHDERGLAKKVTTTVAVRVVEPTQIVCADGVTATDASGKCCGVGETTVNGICCPPGVTAVDGAGKCCQPGQIFVTSIFGCVGW